jgi:chemotaxis protein MotB
MATPPKDAAARPIIIKRIKKAAHGHHGGAWKIAYADFVTAMMAFFLLMWLLGSTAKGDLNGIAEYFNSPLQVAMGGGSGSGDSSSILQGGGKDLTRTAGQVKEGDIKAEKRGINLQALPEDQVKLEREQLEALKGKVAAVLEGNPRFAEFKSQIKLDLTQDGLRVQIVDEQNRPMFDSGGASIKDYARDILRAIGRVLNDVPNKITISGHTDASPFSGGERGYSNWELSADRANASRRELVAGGMLESKILRVVGLAAAVPMDPVNPTAPLNRRISLIIMNREAAERALKSVSAEAQSTATEATKEAQK